jgi:hypothetical protein
MATLNVALMGVLTTTLVAPLAGTVDTTEGTVTVSWPHPATKTTNKAASQYVIPNLILRISSLSPYCVVTVSKADPRIDWTRSADKA